MRECPKAVVVPASHKRPVREMFEDRLEIHVEKKVPGVKTPSVTVPYTGICLQQLKKKNKVSIITCPRNFLPRSSFQEC